MRKAICIVCTTILLLTMLFVPVSFNVQAATTEKVNDSYTFDFEKGNVADVSKGTPSKDSGGNTFYPLRSTNTIEAKQEDITVIDKDGNASTVGTWRISADAYAMVIPVDKNGIPFELDPNSTYKVDIVGYAKRMGTWDQLFFGGGAVNSHQSSYSTGGSVTFSDSTNSGNAANLNAMYPIFRTSSYGYADTVGAYTSTSNGNQKVRYFEEFNCNNNGQYFSSSLNFETGDFNEENGCFKLVGSDGNSYTFGSYFCFYFSASYVNCYSGSTLVSTGPAVFNIDSITITKTSETATVTLDANGGSFSQGTTLKYSGNTGTNLSPSELPVREGYIFKGWSLTKGGDVVSAELTKELGGKTLYAVWEIDILFTYDRFERVIDYSAYTVRNRGNCWSYTTSSPAYQSIVKDASATGGAYLHYHCDNTAGAWLGNYTLTLTASGNFNASGSGENNLYLPENTTYKATIRMRTNNLSGRKGTFFVSYGDYFHTALDETKNNYKVLLNGVEETEGFETYELIFTTPSSYDSTSNMCFIGFTVGGTVALDYDIDYVILQKVVKTDFYTVENGVSELIDSGYYCPGDTVDLPTVMSKEIYSYADSTADILGSVINGWYSDELLQNECEKVARAGNRDTVFYADAKTVIKSKDNQIGYCGFDVYEEESAGKSIPDNSVITLNDKDSYTGSTSLKATGDGVFEIRNSNKFKVIDKTTYTVSFTYKATEDSKISFGLGKIYGIEENYALSEFNAVASDSWVEASVTFTADFSKADYSKTGYIFVGIINTDGEVCIDDITVSSAIGAIGVSRLKSEVADSLGSQALRFMMAYKADGDAAKIKIDGETYTVEQRGILVKSAGNTSELIIENAGKKGIVATNKTDKMDTCWSYNSVSGNVIFSTYIKDFSINDERMVSARGYVKLSDGTVYYSDIITACVNDIPEGTEIIGDDADIVTGKLQHSGVDKYSIVKNSSYESMNDYYLYLPAGTEIEGKEFAVYPYDAYFTLKSEELNPEFISGIYVIPEDSYVRLVAKGKISDIKITVPSDVAMLLEKGSREYLTYDQEVYNMSKEVEIMGDGSVNYIFLTDSHVNAPNDYRMVRQMESMVKLANENDNIDFVVMGGDITSGFFSSKELAYENMNYVLAPLKNCNKPVFLLFGNHDDNSYHVQNVNEYFTDRIISDLDWTNNFLNVYCPDNIVKDSQYAASKYYYYDIPEKKTRIVCLDSVDTRAKFDENGNVISLQDYQTGSTASNRYKSGYSFWDYDDGQIQWLVKEAMSAPDDWDYVYLSHMGIDGNTNSYYKVMYNGPEIRKILNAFQFKKVYESDKYGTYDFTGTTGKVTAMSFGHQHTELVLYSEDIDLWQISTACANIYAYQNGGDITVPSEEILPISPVTNKGYAWTWYYRQIDTPSASCFDIISANKNKVIKRAFGSGSDKDLYYK